MNFLHKSVKYTQDQLKNLTRVLDVPEMILDEEKKDVLMQGVNEKGNTFYTIVGYTKTFFGWKENRRHKTIQYDFYDNDVCWTQDVYFIKDTACRFMKVKKSQYCLTKNSEMFNSLSPDRVYGEASWFKQLMLRLKNKLVD